MCSCWIFFDHETVEGGIVLKSRLVALSDKRILDRFHVAQILVISG